ncbi:UPF0573 protein C2orf70 homolog B-like [Orbicella faveolata]|uniref:UPF0573 protein C2orf70 homolog B-like n=1 Tax=Orbicella faveolata TaxID=48498 RepID=UPI0009E5D551|nr:UPF0573 protein C2orf70 homolog B-like [Orbicella faveolata]
MLSPFNTTNQTTSQDPKHMPGYAGYCPQAKFWHYGDTFGNTTAKCFQEKRTAKLNSSVMRQPGTSGDGRTEFPTVYSNNPNLVLAARTRTRERWRNAKKYSLFNEHERGRELKKFDQLAQSHRDHYMDRSGTVQRVEHFVISRKEGPKITDDNFFCKGVKISCPLSGELIQTINGKCTIHLGLPLKMSPTSMCTWRDRALRDVYFEKR